MVSTAKIYTLKLVPKLKLNKSLKLVLVDMESNNSILMQKDMTGMAK